MGFKLGYRQKLLIYLSAIFIVFTVLVFAFQYQREKEFKRVQIESDLDNIAELTYNYLKTKNLIVTNNYRLLDTLQNYIPIKNIRITIIDKTGVVLYDSEVADASTMANHLYRPEVQEAITHNNGANIRESKTTGLEYYYYTKKYPNLFIRAAAHYDVEIKKFLHVENVFIFYIVSLFLITWVLLNLMTKKVTSTLVQLKDFATDLSKGIAIDKNVKFPEDEFGTISNQILDIYGKLNNARGRIEIEKNKLYAHLNALNEGVAFFKSNKKVVLRNTHFIEFLSVISNKSNIPAEKVLDIKAFKPLSDFITKNISDDMVIKKEDLPHFEETIYKHNRSFNIHAICFIDKSFEIIIKDITKLEKQRVIKEQMTSNLAHELKTPVTIILGYLELLKNNNLTEESYKKYINSAYFQSERLSELIQDISLLNKISEAKTQYKMEELNLNGLLFEVKESLDLKLEKKNIQVNFRLSKPIVLLANKSLLMTVFYNLFENAIKYGGNDTEICLNNYLEDNNYYYFSFSNTGNSIDEKHFLRIFERFYRVDESRARTIGGTGLGLAIVKNAIQLHGGNITVRDFNNNGVEFLFTLAK